ncbi:hypothetical protein [Rossellomorea marisflavi]|uniref:hypothetical protein n=1 Tax=Rossellomorea marisflavi TaxID=189381 RepID=UPI0009A57526|nr:hypothetical protein [Rossellomorea marisflavi]
MAYKTVKQTRAACVRNDRTYGEQEIIVREFEQDLFLYRGPASTVPVDLLDRVVEFTAMNRDLHVYVIQRKHEESSIEPILYDESDEDSVTEITVSPTGRLNIKQYHPGLQGTNRISLTKDEAERLWKDVQELCK